MPWNFFLPSGDVKSNFTIPEPLRSCKTIEEVTIGPIPREMTDPKLAPRMIERYSNCARAFCPRPKRGTSPIPKKRIRMMLVHFNFSLKESFFWVGLATSGRLPRMDCKMPITFYLLGDYIYFLVNLSFLCIFVIIAEIYCSIPHSFCQNNA